MPAEIQKVSYGYEPPIDREKGTLVYYDTFEDTTDEELDAAARLVTTLTFTKLVLYPIHEETWRRMAKDPVSPYHKREKRLSSWVQDSGIVHAAVAIDGWEGKRKKYTPIDSALRHLTETLPGPHFLYLSPDMANGFASFSSFEGWIVKIRLLLSQEPEHVHPRLEQYRHRWSVANKQD